MLSPARRRMEFQVLAHLRPYIPTALLAVLIFYFGYHALTGDRGILRRERRNETLASRTLELKRLQAERKDLEIRVRLLSDRNLSKDLLEERAMILLGFVDPRDYVIRTTRQPG